MERKPCEVSEHRPSHTIQWFTVKPSPRCRDAHPRRDMGYQSPMVPTIGSAASSQIPTAPLLRPHPEEGSNISELKQNACSPWGNSLCWAFLSLSY